MKYSTLLTVSAILAIATGAAINAHATDTTVASIDNPNGPVIVAAGDTLTVTGPVVSTGDSSAARFDKQGAGTLVLQGDNTFKRIKHTAGRLVFDGGASTVSGGSGTGADDAMNILLQGDETVVTGGGSFTVGSGNPYVAFRSRSMVVTNGTVDATAVTTVLLCNFKNGSLPLLDRGIVTIGKGGRFRAKTMRPHQTGASTTSETHGFSIVDGGVLEITGANGLVLDGTQYGLFLLDGGTILNSASATSKIPGSGTWTQSPFRIGAGGATFLNANKTQLTLAGPYRTAVSGASDGGIHFAGKGFVTISDATSTHTGGTYLDSDDGMLFTFSSDAALGAVPSVPADNIFVRGSNGALFTGGTLQTAANRNVLVSSNRTFNVVARNTNTLTIHGEVNGAHDEGALPTTTTFKSCRAWTAWDNSPRLGLVTLDPGAGRTNNIGKLLVEGNLALASGTTLISGSGIHSCVQSNGTLTVSGGELVIAEASPSKFFRVNDGGTNDVCGGTVNLNGGEYLNAVNSGTTIVRDGGVVNCGRFRVAQQTAGSPVALRLATNGTLRATYFGLDTSKDTSATVLFDGGTFQATQNGWVLRGLNDNDANNGTQTPQAAWNGITFSIGPGGAVLDNSKGVNILWNGSFTNGVTAGGTDGGLTARGNSHAVVIYHPQYYNGPTGVDGTLLQVRGDNLLPSGTPLLLENDGEIAFNLYDNDGNPGTSTAATVGGVAGNGKVRYCSMVAVSGTIAPSIGGTIEFDSTPASLSATLLVEGDATGCGKVKFDVAQDLSTLSLVVTDAENLDKNAAKDRYQIVDGNYTGRFSSVAGLPDDWAVSYRASGVYLSHIDAFTLIVR